MAVNTNGSVEMWKWIASFFAGIAVTLCTVFFSGMTKAITRAEMMEYVQTNAPYVTDKDMIRTGLADLKSGQVEITKRIETLAINQAKVMQKLDIR